MIYVMIFSTAVLNKQHIMCKKGFTMNNTINRGLRGHFILPIIKALAFILLSVSPCLLKGMFLDPNVPHERGALEQNVADTLYGAITSLHENDDEQFVSILSELENHLAGFTIDVQSKLIKVDGAASLISLNQLFWQILGPRCNHSEKKQARMRKFWGALIRSRARKQSPDALKKNDQVDEPGSQSSKTPPRISKVATWAAALGGLVALRGIFGAYRNWEKLRASARANQPSRPSKAPHKSIAPQRKREQVLANMIYDNTIESAEGNDASFRYFLSELESFLQMNPVDFRYRCIMHPSLPKSYFNHTLIEFFDLVLFPESAKSPKKHERVTLVWQKCQPFIPEISWWSRVVTTKNCLYAGFVTAVIGAYTAWRLS